MLECVKRWSQWQAKGTVNFFPSQREREIYERLLRPRTRSPILIAAVRHNVATVFE